MRTLLIAALAVLVAACGQPRVDAEFGQKVRAYLLANPEVLVEVNTALKLKRDAQAINANRRALERDPRDRVLNPGGEITVVELFDYNCGYCKVITPEILELARTHPRVRFVFKDMVIFGETSEYAAAGAALARSADDFVTLHKALMAAKPLDDAVATRILTAHGVDPAAARREQQSPARRQYLSDVHALAGALGVDGTPAFIIGDTLVHGADPDAIKAAIAAELRRKKGGASRQDAALDKTSAPTP